MPRKPWQTRATAPQLTESMRFVLTTGDYRLRARFPEAPERLQIFMLAHPSPKGRERLRHAWVLHRAEILRQWKAEKRSGLPWAEREFSTTA